MEKDDTEEPRRKSPFVKATLGIIIFSLLMAIGRNDFTIKRESPRNRKEK